MLSMALVSFRQQSKLLTIMTPNSIAIGEKIGLTYLRILEFGRFLLRFPTVINYLDARFRRFNVYFHSIPTEMVIANFAYFAFYKLAT